MGSCVHFQISSNVPGKGTAIVFQRIPIIAVERLPLRSGVGVPEGGELLRTVQEISLCHQMAL